MFCRGVHRTPAGDQWSPLRINKFDPQKTNNKPRQISMSVGVAFILYYKLEFIQSNKVDCYSKTKGFPCAGLNFTFPLSIISSFPSGIIIALCTQKRHKLSYADNITISLLVISNFKSDPFFMEPTKKYYQGFKSSGESWLCICYLL